MADSKGRELGRQAASGDANAALQLAHHGARIEDTEFLTEGLLASLQILGLNELNAIQYAVGQTIAKKLTLDREENPQNHTYEKAVEFHVNTLGKVSLGEFVCRVTDFVNACRSSPTPTSSNTNLFYHASWTPTTRIKDSANKAFEVLSQYTGDFVVSCNSPLRIYAVKRELSPEEKAHQKMELERIRLEEELKEQEKQRLKLIKQIEKKKSQQERLRRRLEELHQKTESKNAKSD